MGYVGLGGLESIRFRVPVVPGDRLTVMLRKGKVRRNVIFTAEFQAFVGETLVADGVIKASHWEVELPMLWFNLRSGNVLPHATGPRPADARIQLACSSFPGSCLPRLRIWLIKMGNVDETVFPRSLSKIGTLDSSTSITCCNC